MTARLMRFALPAYLLLCLIIGGSAQGVWANLLLQLLAVAMLAALALRPDRAPAARSALPVLGAAFVALALAQLVPLPPPIWTALPGRALVAHGFDLLGMPRPWLPWSLTPTATLAALFPLLVPCAMFAATIRNRASKPYWLIAALLLGTLLGVMLGFVQVRSGSQAWYLYRFSAFGQAAGFFANSNHMGSLLLANIPFVTALAADQFTSRRDLSQRGLVIGSAVALAFVLIIAIALNHSLAVLLLGGPVILLSLTLPTWGNRRVRLWLAAAAILALAGSIGLGASQGKFALAAKQSSVQTRSEIWSTAGRAIADFRLSGSGLGSFERIEHLYENRDPIDTTYINHAHNDYLEVAVELGWPGLVLIALFLIWWTRRVVTAWGVGGNVYARAASIASGSVLLHSLVDFPLRTAAISGVFALSLGLLAVRIAPARADGRKDLWPSRHLTIG